MGWVSKKIAESIDRSKKTDTYWVEKAKLDFALELDHICRAANINGKSLAERFGKSAAYISRVFRGDTNLTIESMVKLTRAAGAKLEIKITSVAKANVDTLLTPSNVIHIPGNVYGKLQNAKSAANTEITIDLGKNTTDLGKNTTPKKPVIECEALAA